MSFDRVRRSLRSGTEATGVIVVCLLLGVAELSLFIAVAVWTQGRDLLVTLVGAGIYRLLLVVVLAAALPVCYALYRQDATLRELPGTATTALRADGLRVLAASLVARTVAILVTLVVFAVFVALVLGVDTLAVWSDALLGVAVDRPTLVEWGVLAAGLAAAWLVNGLLDYQDLLVIDGEASARDAWRASTTAVLSRPRWYPWQALYRGFLLAAPWLATILAVFALEAVGVPETGPATLPILLALAVLFVVTLALARATLVAYHVETTETVVEPALDREPTPVRDNLVPVAVTALVVFAAVGGVVAVRTGDVAPGPDVPDATLDPDDPAATVETAIVRTTRQSHAKTELAHSYNETTDTWERNVRIDSRIDYERDHLLVDVWFAAGEDGIEQTIFAGDGLRAARGDNVRMTARRALQHRDVREPWVAVIGEPFQAIDEDLRYLEPGDAEGWTLRTANESTLVYTITDPAAVEAVDLRMYLPSPDDEDVTYRDAELRLAIDRDRGTIERVSQYAHFEDHYDEDDVDVLRLRSTITYRDVGEVAVARPDSLGGPGPLETIWDVVYYA